MSDHQSVINSQAPAIPYAGRLGPTGPAPLSPSGVTPKLRHGVLIQLVTGVAWIGGTGVGTGMGVQLSGTGTATGFVGLQQYFVRATDLSRVAVNATQGVISWLAT